MRFIGTGLIAISLVITAGCSPEHRSHVARCETEQPAAWCVESPSRPTPAILFDRVQPPPSPGRAPITAEDFAYRSNWPSTPGYYSGGETVSYCEWYYDNQNSSYPNLDYTTRQFQSYRYGTKFR